jgi:hypothetical protein
MAVKKSGKVPTPPIVMAASNGELAVVKAELKRGENANAVDRLPPSLRSPSARFNATELSARRSCSPRSRSCVLMRATTGRSVSMARMETSRA